MIRGHGGNVVELAQALGCPTNEIFDLSSNINPFGPPPGLLSHLQNKMDQIGVLPEADAGRAVEAFADRFGLASHQVLAGNGTTQFIYDLPRALPIRRALIVGPTYADYRDGCHQNRAASTYWLAREEEDFQPDWAAVAGASQPCDTIYICNPNNPTGILVEGDTLRRLSRQWTDKTIIVDESYLPFVKTPERWSLMRHRPANVLVLHSLSKIYRIPGLRIGFIIGARASIDRLRAFARPWRVNSLALEAVRYLLRPDDALDRFVFETQARLEAEKKSMVRRLSRIPGMRLFSGATGFLLVRLPDPYRSETLVRQLARKKILVRDCANFEGLSDRFIRISLQDRETNRRCAAALEGLLND